MEKELNHTAKTIISTPPILSTYDRQIKNLLACKPILAMILKEVVSEVKDMSVDKIEACIEGEIFVDCIPIEPGFSNHSE